MGKRDGHKRRGPESYAAFDPADVDDAKRGYPLGDLSVYAAARQLGSRRSERLEGLLGALPRWPDYVFGIADGRLSGDRYGLVEHELYEIETNEHGLHPSGSF